MVYIYIYIYIPALHFFEDQDVYPIKNNLS